MKIKSIINYLSIKIALIFLSSLILYSCEDVIQVDLNSVDPAIVIEAKVKDDGSVSTAIITKSTDFYKPGEYEKVSNAIITLSDDAGNSDFMEEVAKGEYQSNLISGKIGSKYSIKVNIDGEIFEAESTIPNKLTIDSLSCEEAPKRPGDEKDITRFILHIYFQDIKGVDDYCRFVFSKDGEQFSGIYLYEDKFTDGNKIDARIFLDSEALKLNPNDLLNVELQSIDKACFYFYLTANSVNTTTASEGGRPRSTSVAPTNPVTNWSNKALGYFSAYTVSRKSLILTK